MRQHSSPGSGRAVLLLGVVLLASACATPVGVTRVDTQEMYRSLTTSVLSTGELSQYSENLLTRLGLRARFDEMPEAVLAGLRGPGAGLDREYLIALSELSFFYATKSGKPEYFLASAVYAWSFLFSTPGAFEADPLDPRLRLAANLYNVGLAQGLAAPDGESVLIEPGKRTLPFGSLEIAVDDESLLWSGYRMSRFVAVMEFKVRGLLNRYRQAGIGTPLAAELTPVGEGPEAEAARKRIPPRLKVPVTALLRMPEVVDGIASGQVQGKMTIYSADETETVEIAGRRVPLELEPSAVLAYQLEDAPIWDSELAAFFSALKPPSPESLVMLHPYRPGKIPVVLVHGTASSPARWADMVNELGNDPRLRDRIDFWLFTYNTSNPILVSASQLRAALRRIVGELDPTGKDPGLRQMVVIGHSQGGLLTRLMVTDSSNRFWAAVTDVPFDKVQASDATKALVKDAFFFEPLPFVTRVVFIATPHGGSFRVSAFVLNVIKKVVTLPVNMAVGLKELGEKNEALAATSVKGVPNAVENMSPSHHFVRTLSASPIAPGVTAHSIVAVPNAGPFEGQDDGMVAYKSAHVTGPAARSIASEKVVRSYHSTQSTPGTIQEVRRILYEHLGIPCGLECTAVERVDAAEASMAKPDAPAEPAGSGRP